MEKLNINIFYLILVLVSISLLNCTYEKKSNTTVSSKRPLFEKKSQNKIINDSLVLLTNSIEREFSNPKTKDKFIISVIGKNLLFGEVIFIITDSNGKEIFNEKYPSNFLINEYILSDNPTVIEKEENIKNRISDFFSNDKFYTPAINEEEIFDSDYSNETIWNEIKSDRNAIGFYYIIGLEVGCKIAYSKKDRKIVKYFCCC